MDAKRDIRISKSLSYLLRHGAIKENLPIDESGNVLVKDMLNHNKVKTNQVTLEDLKRVVEENSKQRFKLQEVDGEWYISANQGHSLSINNDNLVRLTPEEVPSDLFHGTYKNKLELINETGLNRMTRKHIHLTNDMEYIRKSCNLLIYIDTRRCLQDGIEFFKSENMVYLTSGIDGVLDKRYFRRVIERSQAEQTREDHGLERKE